ncbi:MAG: metal-sulfur cluster assembly factor [Rhodocyclaceae bacterium]|nr:metal-sulfur cluster assembly factor [Rhodocyclaceae bacterium]
MKDKSAAPVLPDRDAILAGLRGVIDPEVGMNIVDLGLVYRVDIGATGVTIDMTMTSPACPMGDMMVDEVKGVLDAMVPPGTRTEVNLVWSPPWDPSRMSETAKKHFSW